MPDSQQTDLSFLEASKVIANSQAIERVFKSCLLAEEPAFSEEILFLVNSNDFNIFRINLLETVYWKLKVNNDSTNLYLSLSGQIVEISQTHVRCVAKMLEDSAATDLMEVMSFENDLNADLLNSLTRQASVHLDLKGIDHQMKDLDESIDRSQSIHFQGSVVVGKREYRLLLLQNDTLTEDIKASAREIVEFLQNPSHSIEEKSSQVRTFYQNFSNHSPEQLENLVFSEIQQPSMIFGSHYEDLFVDKAVALRGMKFSDLFEEGEDVSENAELSEILHEIQRERLPHQKSLKFLSFLSSLQNQHPSEKSNADYLLPRVAFSIIKAQDESLQLPLQVHFVEQFLHPQLSSGIIQYSLTNMKAALQVINDLSPPLRASSLSPTGPTQLSALISSIGNVPRVIGAAFASSLRTSSTRNHIGAVTNTADSNATVLPLDAELEKFRERMLAANSINDLSVGDLNPLLEDYKNLLYMLMKH